LNAELVQLYFQTVHILCPVLDEIDFCNWYHYQEVQPDHSPLRKLVFHAVLFSAFPYLNEKQLSQTPFQSVPVGHKALFGQVRRLYHLAEGKFSGHVALVQTSLLLSHWSPYDNSREVNTFWVDEAFHHAITGRVYDGKGTYHRVIWWCCIVRNRALALGLRRPHKLRRYEPGRILTIADFDPNASIFGAAFKRRRVCAARIFISLCKLSVMMNKIVLLRHNVARWDDWRVHRWQDPNCAVLDSIALIDQMLSTWNCEFEYTIARMNHPCLSRQSQVSIHMLRIVSL
jgi:hypothetical protein